MNLKNIINNDQTYFCTFFNLFNLLLLYNKVCNYYSNLKDCFFQNVTTFEYLYLANSSRLVLILSCHCDCVEVSEYKSKNDLRS